MNCVLIISQKVYPFVILDGCIQDVEVSIEKNTGNIFVVFTFLSQSIIIKNGLCKSKKINRYPSSSNVPTDFLIHALGD